MTNADIQKIQERIAHNNERISLKQELIKEYNQKAIKYNKLSVAYAQHAKSLADRNNDWLSDIEKIKGETNQLENQIKQLLKAQEESNP